MNRATRIIRDETDSMDCPKCGKPCCRDEVHNGVCMLYGPWGCSCGWSEDSRYDFSDGTVSRLQNGGVLDSCGGFTPLEPEFQTALAHLTTEGCCDDEMNAHICEHCGSRCCGVCDAECPWCDGDPL